MTKEAMQQALKALTNCTDYDNQGDPLEGKDVVNDLAIEALIEALKQEQGDPVATLIEHYAFTDGIVRFDGVENMEQLPVGTKLYTTPQSRKIMTDEQKTKIARMFSDRVANECNINAEDHWKLHSVSVLDDINFILQAIQEIKE